MPRFGKRSLKNLSEAHPDLQRLFHKVIQEYDCTVIEGHRPEAEQNKMFEQEKSKLKWPDSNHNKIPSYAVDVVPYPINWSTNKWNMYRFYHFAGFVRGVALEAGIKIRWGGDWNGNFKHNDQNFHDLPHFELVTKND